MLLVNLSVFRQRSHALPLRITHYSTEKPSAQIPFTKLAKNRPSSDQI